MTTITSLSNPRVKDAVKLRDRRGRERQRRIVVEGRRELRRALAGRLDWVEAFCCEELLTPADLPLVAELQRAGAERLPVSRAVFEKLAFGERAEGIVAVAQTPICSLDAIVLPPRPVVAVLAGIEKPGNVGAIVRTADAAGVAAVLIADPATDLFNPNVIRASQGTIFTLPVAAAPGEAVRQWLRERDCRVLAARVDGAVELRQADLRPPVAIVLGSEAAGLGRDWAGDDIGAVRLPMLGTVDSLNVSVTAGVLFYEALRQRSEDQPSRPG